MHLVERSEFALKGSVGYRESQLDSSGQQDELSLVMAPAVPALEKLRKDDCWEFPAVMGTE